MFYISQYSFLPLISAIFVIVLGFFVWVKRPKDKLGILFLFYCFTIAVWLFGTFKMFNARSGAEAIFWDRIIYIGVVFIPIFLYHFGLVYCRIKNQRFSLIAGYLLAFFFLPASQTDLFVKDLFYYSWGVHTRAQILHHPFLIYFFAYFILFFVNLFLHYRRTAAGSLKQQIKYILIGFAVLDIIGPLAFLPAYGVSVYPVIFLSAIPFVLLLTYAVVRHNALDLRIIGVEVLASVIIFVFFSEIFFYRSRTELILRLAAFAVVFLFGFLFTRSIKGEIRRREEIQRLAAELKSANEKLRELDRIKNEFLSIAAHQLRTPLTIVKGYISMIQEGDYGSCPNPKIGQALENVYQSNEHLINLVDNFLDVSRIESGRTEYKFEKADLRDILEEIIKENAQRVKEKKLKLESAVAENLPKIEVDAEKIHHVMFNFLSNSIKYTDKGFIKIELFKESGQIICQISDSGIGLSSVDKENLFQKFYRSKNARQKSVEGVGLGLFVCRKFIEAHGGQTFAESPGPGKGSVFGFRLPVDRK